MCSSRQLMASGLLGTLAGKGSYNNYKHLEVHVLGD